MDKRGQSKRKSETGGEIVSGKPSKRSVIKINICIIAIVCIVLLLLALDSRLVVRTYQIESSKVDDTVQLLLVADLHSCRYGEGQRELTNRIRELNPDMILYAGDIMDDEIPHDGTIQVLQTLEGQYPSFYVTGNHEFWSGEVDVIKEVFRSYGVAVLEGEGMTLEVNGQRLNICGVDDPDGSRYGVEASQSQQLEQAFADADTENFTVLIAHRPERIKEYKEYPWDLVVSGHAHGGQWRIPGILNGLYAPNQGIFPEYAGGLYNHGSLSHVVSRGLARESTRIPRLFNRPELVMIEVEAVQEDITTK